MDQIGILCSVPICKYNLTLWIYYRLFIFFFIWLLICNSKFTYHASSVNKLAVEICLVFCSVKYLFCNVNVDVFLLRKFEIVNRLFSSGNFSGFSPFCVTSVEFSTNSFLGGQRFSELRRIFAVGENQSSIIKMVGSFRRVFLIFSLILSL